MDQQTRDALAEMGIFIHGDGDFQFDGSIVLGNQTGVTGGTVYGDVHVGHQDDEQ